MYAIMIHQNPLITVKYHDYFEKIMQWFPIAFSIVWSFISLILADTQARMLSLSCYLIKKWIQTSHEGICEKVNAIKQTEI